MFDIAWSTIRNRKGGFVAAFIAVLCGSAVITACGVLLMSGLTSGVAPERYAGATVMVGGQQYEEVTGDFDPALAERARVPESVARKAADVEGVRKVVRDHTVEMTLQRDDRGSPGQTLALDHPLHGHGWSSTELGPFELSEGRKPAGDRETTLDVELADQAGLRVGDTAHLSVGTSAGAYEVVGLVEPPASGLDRQSAAFFTDGRAAQLDQHSNGDTFTALGVLGEEGVDAEELASQVRDGIAPFGGLVYTGEDMGNLEFLDIGGSRTFLAMLSGSFGGTALAVVIFVVASTLSLVIHQRRRELAMLRAIAATPRQVQRMIGSEVLLVSSAGALLGTLPGFLVAGLLRDAFSRVGVLPADFPLSLNPLPAVVSVLLSVLGAGLAGYVSAYRIAKTRPVEALSESEVEPSEIGSARRTTGVVLVLFGLVSAIGMPLAIPGELALAGAASSLLTLMVGSALLGPILVASAARLMTPLLRRSRVSGYLAAANSSANARRLSSAVVPLALGAAMALMQLSMLHTVQDTAKEQATEGVVADRVLTSASTGLSTELTDEVRAFDGVGTVTAVVRSQVILTYGQLDERISKPSSAQGLDPRGLDRTLDLDVREGTLDDLRGDTVALSWTAAETAGLEVGDTADLTLGDGKEEKPEVVAIYGNGLGFGDVTLPHGALVGHTTDRQNAALLVSADQDAGPGVDSALERLAERTPNLTVQDGEEFSATQESEFAQQSWTNIIANGLLLLYVLIAVVNTLVMATAGRSREFAMLRLIGTSTRQARQMMLMETSVVVLTALAVGVAIAIPPAVGSALALTGQPLPYVQPLAWGGVLLFVALLGWLSISLPTRSALRGRPIDKVYASD
ncbi:ABC transporter permease [Streptomyces oceani]|uniref:ABC transporter permease n=1 Tax=Streptomyces oceani TaxID=1075402 RepID=UPI000ADAB79B|nr:FtsX-like permease family protein [Streptomyces oceani]